MIELKIEGLKVSKELNNYFFLDGNDCFVNLCRQHYGKSEVIITLAPESSEDLVELLEAYISAVKKIQEIKNKK